jgi:hypothetical protein
MHAMVQAISDENAGFTSEETRLYGCLEIDEVTPSKDGGENAEGDRGHLHDAGGLPGHRHLRLEAHQGEFLTYEYIKCDPR